MAKRYRNVSIGNLDKIKGWHSVGKRLRLKSMGLTVASFPAGDEGAYPHAHSHTVQEEVYLLLSGRGEIIVDGKIIRLRPGHAVAVDPPAIRALRSGARSGSTWLMIGAAPGNYRHNDFTEYDEPAFPSKSRRRNRRVKKKRSSPGAGGRRSPRRLRRTARRSRKPSSR